jgi:hypothetical protein
MQRNRIPNELQPMLIPLPILPILPQKIPRGISSINFKPFIRGDNLGVGRVADGKS